MQARPRIGTRVSPRALWNFLDPHVISWRLHGDDRSNQVEELYATRLAVEPVAARLIAGLADADAVEELRALITRMREAMAARDLHAFTEADVLFHTELLTRSGNEMFGCFTTVIAAAVRTRETLVFPLVEETTKGLDMHERLVEEIATANPHVESTSRTLIREAHGEARAALGHWDRSGALS
ncbi:MULTISPECIES: FadR/GntR family transcriptional regulator [unclassified Microbacterium]|uniref:FadR/GntR family transcriptional regulator n=1 Tax=unclassified Microbacterium TaxID=2609290 RepID=UPI00366A389F